jgi:uncharacterized membrane protein YccC
LSGAGNEVLQDQFAKVSQSIEEWRVPAVHLVPSTDEATMQRMLFQLDAISGQLRAAQNLVSGIVPTAGDYFRQRSPLQSWRASLASAVTTLQANLSLRSTAFRHALRLTICLTIAGTIARASGGLHSYWIPMTVILILRPDFAGTFSRGLQRAAGTVVGLIVATAQIYVLPPTFAIRATMIGICVFLLRWLGPANYGFLAMGVTAATVLMLSLTGATVSDLIPDRLEDTLLGGLLALSTYAIWPTREPVEDTLAKLLAAYRDYFSAVAQRYLQGSTADTSADGQRLVARLARTNLEASIERFAAEPSTEVKQIELLRSIMASSHRLVHAVMALEAAPRQSISPPASSQLQRFVTDVKTTLLALEHLLRRTVTHAEMPDRRSDFRGFRETGDSYALPHTLQGIDGDTIVNSVNTLREQILRWREKWRARS